MFDWKTKFLLCKTNSIPSQVTVNWFQTTYVPIQAGKDEMIKTHQGFQSLNIREIPSFQQHEANQQALSNVKYREEWDDEKG